MTDTQTGMIMKINLISRMYTNNDKVSHAAKFEIESEVSNSMIRRILSMSISMIGNVTTMKQLIDIVLDALSLNWYRDRHMAKTDGVKVHVFCYEFGYVVSLIDPNLTVISCMVAVNTTYLPMMTDRPDDIVAEMLVDGSLVYINKLSLCGMVGLPNTIDRRTCSVFVEKPHLIYRKS